MGKPIGKKCNTCSVVNNKVRCSLCKYASKEWVFSSEGTCVVGDFDFYKPKEGEEK